MLTKAREIQEIAERYLQRGSEVLYTDAAEWTETQQQLARGIVSLLSQEGATPNEEGERLLAILMGYTIAVRNGRNIRTALEQAERVLPLITDRVLQCRLAVFCYGECFDEVLGADIKRMIGEIKASGLQKEVESLEESLLLMKN